MAAGDHDFSPGILEGQVERGEAVGVLLVRGPAPHEGRSDLAPALRIELNFDKALGCPAGTAVAAAPRGIGQT